MLAGRPSSPPLHPRERPPLVGRHDDKVVLRAATAERVGAEHAAMSHLRRDAGLRGELVEEVLRGLRRDVFLGLRHAVRTKRGEDVVFGLEWAAVDVGGETLKPDGEDPIDIDGPEVRPRVDVVRIS